MFTTRIKQLIYPLYILPKVSFFKKKKLNRLFDSFNQIASSYPPPIEDLKIFSNMEEDGIILWLISSLGIKKGVFIDIGSNDCINSNFANLVFNFNWEGIFIDREKLLLKIGHLNYWLFRKTKKLNLKFVQCNLTPDNINDIITQHKWQDEIDFMSIDVDGNDYYLWKALNCVRPKIIVIENKIEYGWYDIAIPATSDFLSSTWGASPFTINQLAIEKGYTLVASNKKGFNIFYLRNDLLNKNVPPLKLETLLEDPRIIDDFYNDIYMKDLLKKWNVYMQKM